ncbi:MAG: DUF6691 family protein [Ginsengibacter sp.]
MSNTDAIIKNIDINTDFEVRSLDAISFNESALHRPWWYNFKYFFVGIFFGIILVKSEVISWFRIQEMFRLESFHMYGVIGSAIGTGIISILIIKKFNIKTIQGEKIKLYPKKFHKGQVYGGLIFGFGWALTGACPGPLFALIGTGALVISITLSSAIAGTWVYGMLRDKLPH